MGDFVQYDVTAGYSVVVPHDSAERLVKELPELIARSSRWCAGQHGAIVSSALVSMRLVPAEEPRG